MAKERLTLNRGDIGFGQEKIMAWHEVEGEKRPQYLFKLKLTKKRGKKKFILSLTITAKNLQNTNLFPIY